MPLIVAHRGRARGDLAAQVDAALAGEPYLTRLTALLLRLRYGE
ncbi:MAG: hypothetical protein R3F62_26420 [Planctomycetota bacterium]